MLIPVPVLSILTGKPIAAIIVTPNGSCAQDAAGIAVVDQCRHLLRSFVKSPEYPAHEDVCCFV